MYPIFSAYRILAFVFGGFFVCISFGMAFVLFESPDAMTLQFPEIFFLTTFFIVYGLMIMVFSGQTMNLPLFLMKEEPEELGALLGDEQEAQLQLPRKCKKIPFLSSWVWIQLALGAVMILTMLYFMVRPDLDRFVWWMDFSMIPFSLIQMSYAVYIFWIHNKIYPNSDYY